MDALRYRIMFLQTKLQPMSFENSSDIYHILSRTSDLMSDITPAARQIRHVYFFIILLSLFHCTLTL